jgi:hypothetical protein
MSEQLALHVRKTVESVAFACLSAAEHRSRLDSLGQRNKGADHLLSWMQRKELLKLPSAQQVRRSTVAGYSLEVIGQGDKDLSLDQLKSAYSRSSSLLHERHPGAITDEWLRSTHEMLEDDARSLRGWLWQHTMFLSGSAFLVQMGQFGTTSFFVPLDRVGDLPETVVQ